MILTVDRAIRNIRRKRWTKSEIKADDLFETPEYDLFREDWRGDNIEDQPRWVEGVTGCGPIDIPYALVRTLVQFGWNQAGKIRLPDGLQLERLNQRSP